MRKLDRIQVENFKSIRSKDLALPKIESKDKDDLVALVYKILAAKQANPQSDVSAWEREIDQLVYKLYGLTEKEIKIVEWR